MKKLAAGLVVAFALFYLLTQPANAAELAKGAGDVLREAFNALIKFITTLFG